jgi:hypothetical protein
MERIGTKAGMVRSTGKGFLSSLRDMTPALAVLFGTVMFSFFHDDFAPLTSWQAAAKVPLRFFRFAFVLCIPLYALPKVYGVIIRKKAVALLRVEQEEGLTIRPAKHWIFRPFQGIGIGLLFGTKLLAILQIIAGPTAGTSLLIPEGHFQLGRLLIITTITIFVSLLLSTLWTLDDLGIRYFNRKDQELKMIGKYAGTVMPVIFGFYGILNLLANYPTAEALLFVCKIAVVLYPPLAIFAILHTYFLRSKRDLFSKSDLERGGIWRGRMSREP